MHHETSTLCAEYSLEYCSSVGMESLSVVFIVSVKMDRQMRWEALAMWNHEALFEKCHLAGHSDLSQGS